VSYILTDSQNYRAGNIVVLYTPTTAVLTEACTTDIGNSDKVIFSASVDMTNVNLMVTNNSETDYSIKYHHNIL